MPREGGVGEKPSAVQFTLPDELAASEPIEARGRSRDAVRLLVAGTGQVEHAHFADLPRFLRAGDLVVVNTSATLAASVDGHRADGAGVTVHFATELDQQTWVVELRPPGVATGPVDDARIGESVDLPYGVRLKLLDHYLGERLWRVRIELEGDVAAYLQRAGRPIAYAYVPQRWPLSDYQTVFARDPGSAEMPSAARPFVDRLVTDLVVAGVQLAPITLHTGVSSLEPGEAPLPERFAVPATTARLVNHVRTTGGRVVAVGTTVTRALESAVGADGQAQPAGGWTELVLGPNHPARVVDGLITGWHAPGASHLELLQAVAGRELVEQAYREALRARYLWHEFGDSCLLLP